ncbi:hypothetical protein QFZ76_001304 [Streptomyces sp. V4I2]|nr:hypothetical protein [Streptomyces sp. V4I2]
MFEAQPLLRVQRRQVAEVATAALLLGGAPVDPGDLSERALGAAYAVDEVSLAQAVLADQLGRDLEVGGRGQEVQGAQMPLPVRVDVEDAGGDPGPGPAAGQGCVRVWWSSGVVLSRTEVHSAFGMRNKEGEKPQEEAERRTRLGGGNNTSGRAEEALDEVVLGSRPRRP